MKTIYSAVAVIAVLIIGYYFINDTFTNEASLDNTEEAIESELPVITEEQKKNIQKEEVVAPPHVDVGLGRAEVLLPVEATNADDQLSLVGEILKQIGNRAEQDKGREAAEIGFPKKRGIKADVFSQDLLDSFIAYKREEELDQLRLRPHTTHRMRLHLSEQKPQAA